MTKVTPGKIYLIPNLLAPDTQEKVLPPYILEVIKNTTYFFVENIRSARRYISSLKLGIEISSLQFYLLNKDSKLEELHTDLRVILKGNSVGIISEAGCPGIADPGALLVAWAHQKNIDIIPLVGPSSILMALIASGLNGQSFTFHGYLPIKEPQRSQKIKELEKESRIKQRTQLFMETPYRNTNLFVELLKLCHPNTKLCIAMNLTAEDAYVHTKQVKEWKRQENPEMHKKPAIFLLQAGI